MSNGEAQAGVATFPALARIPAPAQGDLQAVPWGTPVQYFNRDRKEWKDHRLGLVVAGPFAGQLYEVAVFGRHGDAPVTTERVRLFPTGTMLVEPLNHWGLYEAASVQPSVPFSGRRARA